MTIMNKDNKNNIAAAMNKVAENLKPTIAKGSADDDGAPSDKQVLIRVTDAERSRWKEAATKGQSSLSAWIKEALNSEAKRVLDCDHPHNMTKFYPWATICTKCGQRL